MKISLVTAMLFMVLWSCSIKPALAADFYLIGISDDDMATIIDPATISAAPDGHKIFHLAEIGTYNMWTENTIEVDCASERWQRLSVVVHQGGGSANDIDVSWSNKDMHTWLTLEPGSGNARVHDLVCQWPEHKPTGKDVLNFPDFNTALERISAIMTKKK